jgi:hypothetical protein
VGYNLRNFVGYDPTQTVPPPPTRFGRLDAVDAIVNEVYWHTVLNPDPDKPTVVARAADAPVSYPCLWDTPQHDRVEWLGIAQSGGPGDIFSLARNVGEVLGVFGNFAIPDHPNPFSPGYPSSVKFTQLKSLEHQLESLWSPTWPGAFPPIDAEAAKKGATLYRTKRNGKSCLDCHALIDRKDPDRKVHAVLTPEGTDRRAWDNFFVPTRPSGKIAGANVNFVPFTAKIATNSPADPMVRHVVIGTILGGVKDEPPDQLGGVDFGGERRMAVLTAAAANTAAYKARPLNGIWATAPYLHNGSVPNLDTLLRPTAKRPTSFTIGVRTFDPVRVGYIVDAGGFPVFRTTDTDGKPIIGNSNAGHEWGADLSEDERHQLIEYLKTL